MADDAKKTVRAKGQRRTPSPRPRAGARPKRVATRPPTVVGAAPSNADIAMRAYHLYVERGAEGGRDLDDWLQVERELLG